MPAGAVRRPAGTDVRKIGPKSRPLIADAMALEAAARGGRALDPATRRRRRHFRLRRLGDHPQPFPEDLAHELHAASVRLEAQHLPPEDYGHRRRMSSGQGRFALDLTTACRGRSLCAKRPGRCWHEARMLILLTLLAAAPAAAGHLRPPAARRSGAAELAEVLGQLCGPPLQPAVADRPDQRQESAAEVVLSSALREERQRPEQDGEHATGGGRHHVHRHCARGGGAGRRHRTAVLEAGASPRSQGVRQRLRSEQGDGDGGRYAVLGDGRLPPARDRREDRPRDLGQDARRLQEGLPIQCRAAHRAQHGDPRAGHQRGGRELLGGGL